MTKYHSVYDATTNCCWEIPMEQEEPKHTSYLTLDSFLEHYLELSLQEAKLLKTKLNEIKINSVNELNFLEGEDPEEIGISKEMIEKMINYNK